MVPSNPFGLLSTVVITRHTLSSIAQAVDSIDSEALLWMAEEWLTLAQAADCATR